LDFVHFVYLLKLKLQYKMFCLKKGHCVCAMCAYKFDSVI